MSHRLSGIGHFLAINSATASLLLMVVLVGMGETMAERFLPLYLLTLGGGVISVGVLNGLDNLLSALYSLPGGYLSDRLGPKRALLVFNVVAIVGYAIVLVIPSWIAVLAGAVLFLSWSALSLPATLSLVATALPADKRTMAVTMHSLVRRVPMALGPLLGGALISAYGVSDGIRYAFFAAILLALVAMFLQHRFMPDEPGVRPKGGTGNVFELLRSMPKPLKKLLTADILIRFCEQMPYAFIVIWSMQLIENPVTAFEFGILTTFEMATAVVVYIPVARAADKYSKRPFVAVTFFFFSIFPLVLLVSHSFEMLVVAFIVRGLKEFGEPTRKALIVDLAPDKNSASMFGAYYLFRDTVVSVAAFGGAFLWQASPTLNLVTASAMGLCGTLWFLLSGRENKRVG